MPTNASAEYQYSSSMGKGEQACNLISSRTISAVFVQLLTLCSVVFSDPVHVGILNKLGDGSGISLHCKSGDTDLGPQSVPDGGQFGWDFSPNIEGTTLFYCDLSWENITGFHFDAYVFDRDRARCSSKCLWLMSKEGVYGHNDGTGFWEFLYQWTT